LLDAFAKVLAKAKVKVDHQVDFDRMSITERIQELCDRLAGRTRCTFEELFQEQRSRFDLVITFLALLEMTRLKMTRLYQTDSLSEIHIELRATDGPLEPQPEAGGGDGAPAQDVRGEGETGVGSGEPARGVDEAPLEGGVPDDEAVEAAELPEQDEEPAEGELPEQDDAPAEDDAPGDDVPAEDDVPGGDHLPDKDA
jgi:segregation and condensation protein A